jgi:hypothetical protein
MVPDAAPLPARLSWLWTAWAIEIDNRVESVATDRTRRLFRISLAMWTNALRVIDGPTTVAEMQSRARAAVNLGGLERWGWVSIGPQRERRPGFGTARGIRPDTVIRATRAGAYARRVWPQVITEVEAAWRDRFGADRIDALTSALSGRDPSMPWSPPEVHASDGFRTATFDGPGDGEVPLIGQLGQVLTTCTLAFEARRATSLVICADLLRVIAAGPVPIRDLPHRSGVSKEAVAMAVGFGRRAGLIVETAERSVELTADGRRSLAAYRRWARASTNPGLAAALDAILAQHDALAAGLVTPAGCWRAERPYAAHTERLVADPTATLPWQPMVLHRGGWPDGS